MCRLLLVKDKQNFDIAFQLERLATIAQQSKEFQGHGWGCAYLQNGGWRHYKNIKPIWEDDIGRFGSTRLLLAHARSAFQDEGITIENNMPFYDGRYVFIFNGELRGVRIAEQGRIGAEKIFNFIKRFDHGNMLDALKRGTDVIYRRTKYVRAMNIILADRDKAYVASVFNDDPEYFTLRWSRNGDRLVVASEALPGDEHWEKIPTGTVREFS
jgi:predicted glutamine amidotransferase